MALPDSTGHNEALLLDVQALSKTFAVPVLKALNFQLRKGEIHALMGSNGAGKSTLCNIICGIHTPSDGAMLFDGQAHHPQNIEDAEAKGIYMVMQELNLFPTLNVAENLCFKKLGARFGVIRQADIHQRTRKALARVGLNDMPTHTPVSELGVGKQQLLEIARVLDEPLRLLILDEPTAALTDPQIDLLFEQLQQLKAQGVGIIYISHRMDEIQRIADRVSILRDGQTIATEDVEHMNVDKMVNLMAGELEAPEVLHHQQPSSTEPSVEIRQFTREPHFRNIDLSLRAGEVLGIGGLIGSGRTEFLRALFGADQADSGELGFAKSPDVAHRFASPEQAIRAGIGLVVEDRKAQGLMLPASVLHNISLASLSNFTGKLGFMDTEKETLAAKNLAEKLAIKCDSLAQPIQQLSGGNQQKALIARWLCMDLDILLFDEPSRGVDARAKARIHALIREQAALGKTVVVVSSETQELMLVSDRIAVLSNGRLAETFDAQQVSEEQLLEASFRYYSKPETATPNSLSN